MAGTYIGTIGNDNISVLDPALYQRLYGADGDDFLGTNLNTGVLIYMDGGDGNDLLTIGDGLLSDAYGDLYGGDGSDLLIGGRFDDYLYGGAGNDIIWGARPASFSTSDGSESVASATYIDAGGDTIDGGQGTDALYGFGGGDVIFGGDGDDSGTVHYTTTGAGVQPTVLAGLFGGDGSDELYGGRGNDYLSGGAGIDTLFGGTGADLMYGGDGGDLIWADNGADISYGGIGDDFMYSGLYDGVTMYGDAGADQIATGNSIDLLYGGSENDILFSGLGNDFMYGGTGNDAIGGYFGNDTMYGGTGTDYFNLTYDVRAGEYDVIADWSLVDDYLYLPAAYAGLTTYGNYADGAYALVTIGSSYYAVYTVGATAADLAVSTFFV